MGAKVPRALINRDAVGAFDFRKSLKDGGRDISCLGDCQETIFKLAELAGWKDEFAEYIAAYSAKRAEKEKEEASKEEGKAGESKEGKL